MPPTLSPQEFVAKWRHAELRERAGSQEHFLDLCALVGHPTPAEMDPTGETFTFAATVSRIAVFSPAVSFFSSPFWIISSVAAERIRT